jgi:hypothetical protein
VAGSCEYGDEPSGSGATELVITFYVKRYYFPNSVDRLISVTDASCFFQEKVQLKPPPVTFLSTVSTTTENNDRRQTNRCRYVDLNINVV